MDEAGDDQPTWNTSLSQRWCFLPYENMGSGFMSVYPIWGMEVKKGVAGSRESKMQYGGKKRGQRERGDDYCLLFCIWIPALTYVSIHLPWKNILMEKSNLMWLSFISEPSSDIRDFHSPFWGLWLETFRSVTLVSSQLTKNRIEIYPKLWAHRIGYVNP